MDSRLPHQKIKEISHNHTEEFLDWPWNEGGAKLEEEEVDKPIQ
jgi:hypothetical protein